MARRHTIYEVAAAAGVSIATVSRVLTKPDVVSPATREKVMLAVEELSYVPTGAARSLAARSNEAFGLALPELGGPYYAELLSGFEAAAAERGASVMVVLTRGKAHADKAVRRLAGRVDALAVMGGVEISESTLETLRRKVPLVVIAGGATEESFSTENVASARELTGHLLDEHSRTALRFVGDPERAPDVDERHRGFVAAHADRGLEPAPPIRCETLESEGERIADAVLACELAADALVCANDELALALQRTLMRGGLSVPEDVSVTGWDDMMAARYVTPGLTTVRQPVRELGALVVQRIEQLLGGDGASTLERRLPTTVVLRQSCGCA
ncbi:LacI family DNA-binding transcriptional regulator [Tessaracoccus flavescens]|uniref:LacI family transcriptional regulator n=1 Tax=Tessaracoccus flavescens TaxID=399497 RepID=A0A1Q2CV17_9ACTN|nr:LacI family DNA-binding transcriptional regulator [Tessaracoccus flavescens]AQP49936.1 LacI family transcriptional regulator [Tessaracoccus flavescens]